MASVFSSGRFMPRMSFYSSVHMPLDWVRAIVDYSSAEVARSDVFDLSWLLLLFLALSISMVLPV